MGNCLRRDDSAARWAGEEWDFLAADGCRRGATKQLSVDVDESEGLLEGYDDRGGFKVTASRAATEVKIKITKKQLEELLGKVDINELSVQQVLAQLIDVGGQFHESRHRPWTPVLQSIPEAD